MRQNVVRKFKSKADRVMAAVVLDEAQSVEQLNAPSVVVILARRDLVWLQSFFAALDHGRIMDYERMRLAVTTNLDALTKANGSNLSLMPKDNKSAV